MRDLMNGSRGDRYMSLEDFFNNMEKEFYNLRPFSVAGDELRIPRMKSDIIFKDNKYILKLELPGFKKDEISIQIENNTVIISAEKKSHEYNEDDYIRKEIRETSYKRVFSSEDIDTETMDASFENGILTIVANKKVEEKPKTKEVEIK